MFNGKMFETRRHCVWTLTLCHVMMTIKISQNLLLYSTYCCDFTNNYFEVVRTSELYIYIIYPWL